MAVWNHTQHFYEFPYLNRILNTPSQHRVHHGRNKIYLDKNFGDIFSFWDILFGTFQEELKEEKPVYGLVYPVKTFNPITLTFTPIIGFIKKFTTSPTLKNKLKVIFYGPGWDYQQKTDSRFGDLESLIVDLEYNFQPELNLNEFVYVLVNSCVFFLIHTQFATIVQGNSSLFYIYSIFFIFTIYSLSIVFDGRMKLLGNLFEISRQMYLIIVLSAVVYFKFTNNTFVGIIWVSLGLISWNFYILFSRILKNRKYKSIPLEEMGNEREAGQERR
ncbi:hypothetical protein HDU92_006757 [Lobulomyces angularis]|nr:hypothetical protein HDU92_006757 [Lobulomyces angularis]